MGGGNAQKSAAAREKNMKDKGKTDEERKAASAKTKLDSAAFMCELCRQTFMVNAKPDLLYQHVTAKHPSGTDYKACFPVLLADFDPEDPKGEKKAKAEKAAAAAAVKKVVKKKDDGLDMLSAGLGAGKKKKKF